MLWGLYLLLWGWVLIFGNSPFSIQSMSYLWGDYELFNRQVPDLLSLVLSTMISPRTTQKRCENAVDMGLIWQQPLAVKEKQRVGNGQHNELFFMATCRFKEYYIIKRSSLKNRRLFFCLNRCSWNRPFFLIG